MLTITTQPVGLARAITGSVVNVSKYRVQIENEYTEQTTIIKRKSMPQGGGGEASDR